MVVVDCCQESLVVMSLKVLIGLVVRGCCACDWLWPIGASHSDMNGRLLFPSLR